MGIFSVFGAHPQTPAGEKLQAHLRLEGERLRQITLLKEDLVHVRQLNPGTKDFVEAEKSITMHLTALSTLEDYWMIGLPDEYSNVLATLRKVAATLDKNPSSTAQNMAYHLAKLERMEQDLLAKESHMLNHARSRKEQVAAMVYDYNSFRLGASKTNGDVAEIRLKLIQGLHKLETGLESVQKDVMEPVNIPEDCRGDYIVAISRMRSELPPKSMFAGDNMELEGIAKQVAMRFEDFQKHAAMLAQLDNIIIRAEMQHLKEAALELHDKTLEPAA